MDVREHDLPGIGKKFALSTRHGDRMTVIIHHSGDREIYQFDKGSDYPSHAARLEDGEARQLGAILGGAYFQPTLARSMEIVMDQLSVEWFKVEPQSKLAGLTIRDSAIRTQTGASIIAIMRGRKAIPNPQPEDRFEGGDTILVVGERNQVESLRKMLAE